MEEIYYACFKTPLGVMWGAKSCNGLIKFSSHGTKNNFIEELKNDFNASFIESKARFSDVDDFLKGYFSKTSLNYEGEFDLRGTEFQKAIWNALMEVPFGRLSSYGRLAASIGRPKAYRAAGNAVGANPCGLIIPCHRIIHSDGGLGGFGGGLDLKRKLLAHEGVLPNSNEGVEDLVNLTDFFI